MNQQGTFRSIFIRFSCLTLKNSVSQLCLRFVSTTLYFVLCLTVISQCSCVSVRNLCFNLTQFSQFLLWSRLLHFFSVWLSLLVLQFHLSFDLGSTRFWLSFDSVLTQFRLNFGWDSYIRLSFFPASLSLVSIILIIVSVLTQLYHNLFRRKRCLYE